MKAKYKKGEKVQINPEIDNENYKNYMNRTLVIDLISKNITDHPGYDPSVNEPLYDLKTQAGDNVPFSLYEYELINS